MNKLVLIMFALFLNSSCPGQPLKYLIEPRFGKENYVDVTMEFNTGNATETQVNYLNEYGGTKNLSIGEPELKISFICFSTSISITGLEKKSKSSMKSSNTG